MKIIHIFKDGCYFAVHVKEENGMADPEFMPNKRFNSKRNAFRKMKEIFFFVKRASCSVKGCNTYYIKDRNNEGK